MKPLAPSDWKVDSYWPYASIRISVSDIERQVGADFFDTDDQLGPIKELGFQLSSGRYCRIWCQDAARLTHTLESHTEVCINLVDGCKNNDSDLREILSCFNLSQDDVLWRRDQE